MKAFIDRTGGLWAQGALVGKPTSIFTSSGTQHGGQESTCLTGMVPLFHHGMIYVSVPLAAIKPKDPKHDHGVVNGGGFYGASVVTGKDGKRPASQYEKDIAFFQGKHVT